MQPERQRLRLEEVLHTAEPDGRCRIGVRLEWYGRTVQSSAEGVETQHGRVRAAAVATVEAAVDGAGKRVDLDFVGVKAFRAFDGWVVVARLNAEADGRTYRLLGSASCEDDDALTRTAVHAVLDASNRLLARFIQPPPGQGSEGRSAERTPPREKARGRGCPGTRFAALAGPSSLFVARNIPEGAPAPPPCPPVSGPPTAE